MSNSVKQALSVNPTSPLERAADLDATLASVAADPGESEQKFLRFRLGQDTALLAVDVITQVLKIASSEILPVPQMPGCVLGLYNWRGEMLWLVDLDQFLGLPQALSTVEAWATRMVITVQIRNQVLGLVVPQVNDIEPHEIRQIQPATAALFPSRLLPFIQGYLTESGSAVLDVVAIARAPLWQTCHR
ncbi:chemotaxis protein CheW [Leptolyngbya sp. FACHB-261]|uniref:chemotaxis protein CheW n=1 Tax=Leptolyngbya sp. FACHB-261 TaxID=2692806 RepID=UPI001686E095|nr:chemotaxis protein CheW [Leptolyngbya sp. FACHB-261]MBD2102306.1 purine-binding chemotaxis protein CheW [Leptolyngbya sp. FACHB-261]